MKPFEYYEKVENVEYFGFNWVYEELHKYREELDLIPLTTADRKERYAKREIELREEADKHNELFIAAHAALQSEFWKDLREELKYDTLFTEQGILHFEALVKEMQNHRPLGPLDPVDEDHVMMEAEETYLQAKRLLQDYKYLRQEEK